MDFVIQGYTAIRNDRKNGKGGIVATFVQERMRFSVIKLGKEHESIEIWTRKDEITVVNDYNPCNRIQLVGRLLRCGFGFSSVCYVYSHVLVFV